MDETIPHKQLKQFRAQEARRFHRYSCKDRPQITVSSNADQAVLCDVSREGVRLILLRAFKPQQVIDIHFQCARRRSSWTIQAEVKHSLRQPDGSWLAGCQLSRALSADEIAELVDEFQPARYELDE